MIMDLKNKKFVFLYSGGEDSILVIYNSARNETCWASYYI